MKLNNPKYHNLIKLGKSTRFCPQTIDLPILQSKTFPAPQNTSITLHEEQSRIYDIVKDKTSCLVELQTGGGKTVIAIALNEAWGGKTLIACHTLQLAKQFADEFQKFIDVSPTFYCGGKKDMSGDVVVTTHQTLRKKYDMFTGFQNLILDECDLLVTAKSAKAVKEFKAQRKAGFTATIKTEYDDCNDIQFLPIFYGHHAKGKYDMSDSPLKQIFYRVYKKTYVSEHGAVIHPSDYIKFREVLDLDIPRKKAQLKYIQTNTKKGDYVLIMLDRVADVLAFAKYCNYAVTGDTPSEEREQILKDFDKNGGLLVATASILSRGFDNIKINKAFVLFPIKGESQIRQLTGRIIRTYKDKESTLYIWSDSSLSHQLKIQKKVLIEYFNITPIEI